MNKKIFLVFLMVLLSSFPSIAQNKFERNIYEEYKEFRLVAQNIVGILNTLKTIQIIDVIEKNDFTQIHFSINSAHIQMEALLTVFNNGYITLMSFIDTNHFVPFEVINNFYQQGASYETVIHKDTSLIEYNDKLSTPKGDKIFLTQSRSYPDYKRDIITSEEYIVNRISAFASDYEILRKYLEGLGLY